MSDLVFRYSAACVRSGIAALVATAISITLAQRLAVVEPLNALGSYILGRELLNVSINEMVGSSNWPLLLSALGKDLNDAESVTLAQLQGLECHLTRDGYSVRPLRPPRAAIEVSSPRPRSPIGSAFAQAAPMPPSDVVIDTQVPCPGLEQIDDALRRISDDQVIEKARTLSNESNLELYRWQLARNRIFSKAQVSPRTVTQGVAITESSKFRWLTLRELRELDSIPYTSVQQFTAIVNAQMIVSTPYAAVSQGANAASVLVQWATFIFVAYFFLNVRAAIVGGALIQQGSVFATVMSGYFGKSFFVLVHHFPPAAAIYLVLQMSGTEMILGALAAAGTVILTAATDVMLWKQLSRTQRT